MNIPERIKAWESLEGSGVFRAMGLKDGATVLDFGFGHGHYAVAAALAVGNEGRVYAMDSGLASVESLSKRAAEEAFVNIDVLHTGGVTRLGLPDEAVDCVLYYDILHMPGLNRQELIDEARRVLRPGGILSVLPFHMGGEAKEALMAEIMAAGFGLPVLLPEAGLHFGMLYTAYSKDSGADFNCVGKGTVYNYTKQ